LTVFHAATTQTTPPRKNWSKDWFPLPFPFGTLPSPPAKTTARRKQKTLTLPTLGRELYYAVEWLTRRKVVSTERWLQISHVLDYIMQQPTGSSQAVKGEPEKKPRKAKKEKPREQQAKQLRLFYS
jgi:hypothetical protein